MKAPRSIIADRPPDVKEIHVVWMTTGLGCDGDSVSITAASLPSIEDVVMGAIPGSAESASAQSCARLRSRRRLHEILVRCRGRANSIPSCSSWRAPFLTKRSRRKATGPRMGTDPDTGQPITTNEWIDRLAPKAIAVIACRNLRHLRRHSRDARQSDRRDGTGRLSGLELALQSRPADRQCAGLPGAAGQHDGDAALSALSSRRARPDDSARRSTAPDVAVRENSARRLRPRRLLRAGRFRPRIRLAEMPRQNRLLGSGCELQRDQTRLDGRHRRLPERGRHLHRLHHAGIPGQIHAVHG